MRLHYCLMVTFAIVAGLSLMMALDFATRGDLFGIVFMLVYGLAAFGAANDQRMRAELLRVARRFEQVTGIQIRPDPSCLPEEVHFVQDGRVVGKITGLGRS